MLVVGFNKKKKKNNCRMINVCVANRVEKKEMNFGMILISSIEKIKRGI